MCRYSCETVRVFAPRGLVFIYFVHIFLGGTGVQSQPWLVDHVLLQLLKPDVHSWVWALESRKNEGGEKKVQIKNMTAERWNGAKQDNEPRFQSIHYQVINITGRLGLVAPQRWRHRAPAMSSEWTGLLTQWILLQLIYAQCDKPPEELADSARLQLRRTESIRRLCKRGDLHWESAISKTWFCQK